MKTLSLEQRLFAERAVTQYQADLRASTSAQAHLALRGIGQQAANTFRLGVVDSPLAGHEMFRDRLALPYLTPSGPIGFNFRCVRPHDCKEAGCPKYLKPASQSNHLYNVAALKANSEYIVVTEGEIDTISWSMAGVPAVGLAGVETWEEHFSLALDDFPVIYVAGDGDKAGEGMTKRLVRVLENARPITYPRGSDANDLWRSGGADALRALLPV
ncbi:toprim domain-containing protein [Streptomyces johnsoniae]|uniref:Toprim domain-containing protein n=1 Tax=Streptomyces johnsoniae TaxID=3075532 RepID=A0ABU2S0A4_9ACTN|nr:toprim domain-containing protein [Streptomyces sp. DSM 41886]MDT0442342.1 toprim domain-containing protein [Streptomyces sp. DSM 41886]